VTEFRTRFMIFIYHSFLLLFESCYVYVNICIVNGLLCSFWLVICPTGPHMPGDLWPKHQMATLESVTPVYSSLH
jgi:hypothetical protein